MEQTEENISVFEQNIAKPDVSSHFGGLKRSRLSRLLRYGKTPDERVRVLQIVIDHGPISTSLVAAYAGLPIAKTKEIINYLVSEDINAAKIYPHRRVEEDFHTNTVPLYHCPQGM